MFLFFSFHRWLCPPAALQSSGTDLFYNLNNNMLVLEHLGFDLMVTGYGMKNIVSEVNFFFGLQQSTVDEKKNPNILRKIF